MNSKRMVALAIMLFSGGLTGKDELRGGAIFNGSDVKRAKRVHDYVK